MSSPFLFSQSDIDKATESLRAELAQVKELAKAFREEANIFRARIEEAEELIAAAVEIMTPEQVGRWAGVRAWQEGVKPLPVVHRLEGHATINLRKLMGEHDE